MNYTSRIILLAIGMILLFASVLQAQTVIGERDLPASFVSVECVDVTVNIDVVDEANRPNGLIVNEYVPEGWTFKSISPTPEIITAPTANTGGKLSWLFLGSDVMDKTLGYTICVPQWQCATAAFSGEMKYNDPANNGAATTVVINGDTATPCACASSLWDLRSGFNLLAPAYLSGGKGAFQVLGGIGGESAVSSIQRFDPVTGHIETASYINGQPAGVNFPVRMGEGYIIYMKQDLAGYCPNP